MIKLLLHFLSPLSLYYIVFVLVPLSGQEEGKLRHHKSSDFRREMQLLQRRRRRGEREKIDSMTDFYSIQFLWK